MFSNTQGSVPTNEEFAPIPKNGERLLSLSRSSIYKLITPCADNGFKPPVRSITVKTHRHNVRGRRLVHMPSLVTYLHTLLPET
jgi:hypothetical protein